MPQNLSNGEYKVDLGKLDSTTQEVESLKNFIEEHRDEVKAAVALLSQHWQGEAAAQALERFAQWDKEAADVREGVRAMQEAARTAHDNYTGAVSANLNMLRGG